MAVHNLVQSYETACSKKLPGDFDAVIKDVGDENSRRFKNIFSKRTIEDWLISAPHIAYINFVLELVILSFVFHNMEIAVKPTKIGLIFSCICKSLPKYEALGSHRCVDEYSSIPR